MLSVSVKLDSMAPPLGISINYLTGQWILSHQYYRYPKCRICIDLIEESLVKGDSFEKHLLDLANEVVLKYLLFPTAVNGFKILPSLDFDENCAEYAPAVKDVPNAKCYIQFMLNRLHFLVLIFICLFK